MSSGSSRMSSVSRPSGKLRADLGPTSALVSTAGMNPAGRPRRRNRLERQPVAHASGQIEQFAQGRADLDFEDAGRFRTSPQTEKKRKPRGTGFFLARCTKALPCGPSRRTTCRRLSAIAGTQANVSTLESSVGLSKRPLVSSWGGRLRGSALCSSIASIKAPCSPQT